MITSKDLEQICNYNEINKPVSGSGTQIMYLDYPDDDFIRLELIRKNRDHNIDSVLDELPEEPIIESTGDCPTIPWGSVPINPTCGTSTSSLRVMSMNLNPKPFVSFEKLYEEVILYYESVSQSPVNLPSYASRNLDYKIVNDPKLTDQENFKANFRKILTRIVSSSSLIATIGRIGPATSIIIGSNVAEHIDNSYIVSGNLVGMKVIYSSLISPNKIILVRGCRNDHPGLIVVNNTNNGNYYFGSTPTNHQLVWFDVT